MKKFLLLCFAALGLTAWAAPTSPTTPAAEWTILVYMNGDNNLEPFALNDFAEMSRVNLPASVNVIVQFDRIGSYAITSPNWTQTLRFQMRPGLRPLPAQALEDLGETNMGAQQTLADFVAWGKARFPARKTGLIIWDHGDGWRFFDTSARDLPPETLNLLQTERTHSGFTARWEALQERAAADGFLAVRGIPANRAITGPHRAASHDETSDGDKLYNRETQDALQSVLAEQKLDFIGFDACLMSMVETGFALRNVAHVMVGSEELEPGPGWDYTDWLGKLAADPKQNAEQLGTILVDSYRRTYLNSDPTTTLAAVRLARIDALTAAVDQLGNELTARLSQPAFLATLKQARASCLNYAPGYGLNGIDLGDFCQNLATATADPVIKVACNAVRVELAQMIIANYPGTDRAWSTGLAIYFPQSKAHYRSDPDAAAYDETQTVPGEVEFVKTHRWDNFLQAYFQSVP